MTTNLRLALATVALIAMGSTSLAMAQQPGYRGPPGPPRGGYRRPPPPAPRGRHDYNSGYYQTPVWTPPPVVYTPQPSVGINLVIPFHF
jgi:hypothetical protein